eukprot:TRINITY_DN12963_c0_g1_i1.p1 TRINITY_DN12963_c0_g1~~TRINITY_DN12963_c0_g1_i1.p1  ORF type:complete len:197 (+),score=27.08 TRINITY_DN12963_c0_g1_i1:189-779(+)
MRQKNPDFCAWCSRNVRIDGHTKCCQKNPDFCAWCSRNVRIDGGKCCQKNPDFCATCSRNVRVDGHSVCCERNSDMVCFEPPSRSSYIMYHGTSTASATSILQIGFMISANGMLGAGVYLSRDINKAKRYGPCVLKCNVKVRRVKKIDRQGHPMQKSWRSEGYDTAWVPPNCGMVPSGLQENCIADPADVTVLGLL